LRQKYNKQQQTHFFTDPFVDVRV